VAVAAPGRGLRDGSPSAATGLVVRSIPLALALIASAFTAPPARGDDVPATGSSAIVNSLSTSSTTTGSVPISDTTAGGQSAPVVPQDNNATNTQTTTTTAGAGGTATGGNAGPAQGGRGSQSGSHAGNAYANGGSAQSHSSIKNVQSNRTSGQNASRPATGGAFNNAPAARDKFVIERAKSPRSGGAAAPDRTPLPGALRLGPGIRAGDSIGRRPHRWAAACPDTVGRCPRTRSSTS
jgi:hypothetical protein